MTKFKLSGFELTGVELVALAVSAFLLAACSNNIGAAGQGSTTATASALSGNMIPYGGSDTGGGADSAAGSSGSQVQTAAPLSFTIYGIGNHSRAICVPAQSKLVLRMMPLSNYAPLFPANSELINSKNGQPLYNGAPATYTQLRLQISIPGTSGSWDYQSSVNTWSGSNDYSSYLTAVTGTTVATTAPLATPEYANTSIIYGSSPTDGICTYWESQLHGCTLSSVMRAAEAITCPSGQQKLMITNVVSDYPCANDVVGWCQGGSVQTVPDYQQWSAVLEVQTENTTGF